MNYTKWNIMYKVQPSWDQTVEFELEYPAL